MTWEEIGYADGMKEAIKSPSTRFYPTRDRWTAQDEADYLRGREKALRDHELQKNTKNEFD